MTTTFILHYSHTSVWLYFSEKSGSEAITHEISKTFLQWKSKSSPEAHEGSVLGKLWGKGEERRKKKTPHMIQTIHQCKHFQLISQQAWSVVVENLQLPFTFPLGTLIPALIFHLWGAFVQVRVIMIHLNTFDFPPSAKKVLSPLWWVSQKHKDFICH